MVFINQALFFFGRNSGHYLYIKIVFPQILVNTVVQHSLHLSHTNHGCQLQQIIGTTAEACHNVLRHPETFKIAHEQNCIHVKTTRDIRSYLTWGILESFHNSFGTHKSPVYNMTKPAPCRSYRIQPPIEDYEIPTKSYIAQSDGIFGIVSAAIIIHNDRVLLVQRASADDCPNVWEVPGGGAHDNETIVQCAIRELQEETGLDALEVTSMIGEFKWVDKLENKDSQQRKWKIFMFLVTVDSSDLHLKIKLDPAEHQAYLWATAAEVEEGVCGNTRLEWISINQKNAILASFNANNTTQDKADTQDLGA